MSNQPLLLESGFRWCSARFRENRLPFLSSLFIGLLCYIYAFTNKLLNHDETHCLFQKGATVSSGRWGLGALDSIFPNHSMPWIYGILTIVLIAAAICLIIRILRIQNPVLQVLLGGTIMAFPSLTATISYMFTASSFALSFFLAVLSVWFLLRKGFWNTLFALGCMVFSLSIYQSYISVAAGLLVVELLRRTLCAEDFKGLLTRGIGYVLFLGASLGLYYGATQILLRLLDVGFNEYAAGNVGFSLTALPSAALEAYKSFICIFTKGTHGLICGDLSRLLHMVCLVLGVILSIMQLLRTKGLSYRLLAGALIGILPLAINCMYLFTTADSIHTLVLYGFISFYALLAVLADGSTESSGPAVYAVNLMTLALSVIIVCNTYLANQVWLNLQLRYENAYAFYTSLLSDLRQLPQFDGSTPVALIGNYTEPEYFETQFEHIHQITGTKGFLPDSYSKERFLEYYLGVPLLFATEEECLALSTLPEVMDMPVYPYHGSIAAIEDCIVVKLS